jgi:uncharacterized protein YkwD
VAFAPLRLHDCRSPTASDPASSGSGPAHSRDARAWSDRATCPSPRCCSHPLRAQLTDDEAKALLDQHNVWRARFNMAALEWDDDVAGVAQK